MRSVGLLLFAALVIGCDNADYVTPPPDRTPQVVEAVGVTSWNPATITIKAGDVVSFRNTSEVPHNVRFDQIGAGNPADVPNFTSATKSVTFMTAGTFAFHCGIHPAMTGQVIVQP